jgi:hypothetical protein
MGLVLQRVLPDEMSHDMVDRYPTRRLILLYRPDLWAIRHLLSFFTILSVDLAPAAWHGLGFLK